MKRVLKLLAFQVGRAAFAGYGVWSWLRGPRARLPLNPSDTQRLLVIRLDLLGDAVFSLPAIKALAAGFPQAELDVLALPYTAPLLRTVPEIHRVYELDVNVYRRPSGLLRLRSLVAIVRLLRDRHYDVAISLSRLVGGIFAVASGARWRAGPGAETYWGCFNVPLPGRRYASGEHEIDFCLGIAGALGARPDESVPRLAAPSPQDGPSSLKAQQPYVAIVPGASNGSAKQWPVRYWAELVERLVKQGFSVAVCGAASERDLARQLTLSVDVPVTDLVGRTSIPELSRVLAGAALVIGGDTGPLHVAAALDRPVLGIYGPTDPVNTGPRSARARVLRSGIECSPCYDLRSPAECKLPDKSVRCMWLIQPTDVFTAAMDLLAAPSALAEPSGTLAPPDDR